MPKNTTAAAAAGDLVDEVAAAMADDATAPPPPPRLSTEQSAQLAALRRPLPEHLLAQKPVDVNAKWDRQRRKFVDRNGNEYDGQKCGTCGQFLPARHGHLTYAGHAAITERLLEVDPLWSWEPVTDPELLAVLPRFDGGMWIRLTVAGVTRLGYGDANGKDPGHNAVKEIIGDALRNAAMRFGVGLELWHKGDLHADQAAAERAEQEAAERQARLDAAQQLADTAAGVAEPERVTELAERARAEGLDELTIRDPDGAAGALVHYLRHRYSQLAAQPDPAQETAGEADAEQHGAAAADEAARAEQDALGAASESAAAEEAAQAHGAAAG